MPHFPLHLPSRSLFRLFALAAIVLVAAIGFGCKRQSSQPSRTAGAGYPGQPPGPGYPGAPPGQAPGGYYPGPGAPLPPPPPAQPAPPAVPPPGSLPPVAFDPLNNLDVAFMRQQSAGLLGELVEALPANQSAMVRGIPLAFDDKPGEVNAYAACTGGKALMAITDGLLEIEAQMSRAKATDEVFNTRKLDAYLQFIATQQRPNQPIVRPQSAFWDPMQDVDGRKVKRQHEIFDEAVAFVLGHELAHHYLQHTGCVGRPDLPVTPQDIGRVLSNAVPGFNQPNEVAADTNGTRNVLAAGARRTAYHFSEGGALLTLHFFVSVDQMTPAESVLFAFEISHPPPQLRIPIVQQTAANWRATGGAPSVFPFPIPGWTG